MTRQVKVLFFAAVGLVGSAIASFGPLAPSATPCEREHVWLERKMPDTGSYTWLDRVWAFMNRKGHNG